MAYGFALPITKNYAEKHYVYLLCIVAIQLHKNNIGASVEECEHISYNCLHVLIYFIH